MSPSNVHSAGSAHSVESVSPHASGRSPTNDDIPIRPMPQSEAAMYYYSPAELPSSSDDTAPPPVPTNNRPVKQLSSATQRRRGVSSSVASEPVVSHSADSVTSGGSRLDVGGVSASVPSPVIGGGSAQRARRIPQPASPMSFDVDVDSSEDAMSRGSNARSR